MWSQRGGSCNTFATLTKCKIGGRGHKYDSYKGVGSPKKCPFKMGSWYKKVENHCSKSYLMAHFSTFQPSSVCFQYASFKLKTITFSVVSSIRVAPNLSAREIKLINSNNCHMLNSSDVTGTVLSNPRRTI